MNTQPKPTLLDRLTGGHSLHLVRCEQSIASTAPSRARAQEAEDKFTAALDKLDEELAQALRGAK